MFPASKSWSEHDGGSGPKAVDSVPGNESNSVKVSDSITSVHDRESRTSTDEQMIGQNSSTNIILETKLTSDAQSTLTHLAITNSDETHTAKETFSPLLPASPTPESDLEMTVPLALNEKTDSSASSAQMRQFPSTATQPQDPFTQVKHTPYVNGRVQDKVLPGLRTLSPPLNTTLSPLTNANANDDTDFVSASFASVPETLIPENHGKSGSSNPVEDQSMEKAAARLTEESNSQGATESILDQSDDMMAENQQEKWGADAAAASDRLDESFLIMAEGQLQSSGSNQLPMVAEAIENIHARTIPDKSSTPETDHSDPLPRMSTSDHTVHEMKRKVGDPSFISPSVAKRQKRFKVPPAFTFSKRSELPRDPSESARQYRHDFLASRRSSETSATTKSHTIPLTDFPGTTSEHPLDPSGRARQFRQEFLASRRSSETSSPITSPRVQFTGIRGTIQAERWSSEIEKNIEKVTAPQQSTNTEVERQKIPGFRELSPRSQTQVMELDAAALSNSNVSIERDGDDAKPGAQDTPSVYYKQEAPIFVAHSADLEGPDAERNKLIEASFNDESQRAQSIELDLSSESPDRKEIEKNLNAKHSTNQTVDPGPDPMIASHGQLTSSDKDDQPANLGSDKVPKSLSTRIDEFVKQGSNMPTTEMILDQSAEPDTATLKSEHQQRMIEESATTQMPGKAASDPKIQQQSLTVHADMPMPDEIATEPRSQQRLIGVDTESPVPDIQVDREITHLKPIIHTGELTNRPTHASFPVTAFITDTQSHISPAALEPAIQPSIPIMDPDAKAAEEHQIAVQLPVENVKQTSPSVPLNIFDEFKVTYPAYPGDTKHFAAICRKISQLEKFNRMEHQSLWDDFIIRHKIDYPQYLRRCAEEAEDAVPYEIFYKTEIDGAQYQKRVINRRNLDEALALVAEKSSVQVHSELAEHSSNSMSDSIEKMHDEYAPANDDEPLKLVGSKSEPKPATSCEIIKKSSKSRVTIDLTEDDPPDEQAQKTKERRKPSQSSVPHLFNGVSVTPQPLQYRRDRSGSLYQVPYNPPAMQSSPVPRAPRSMPLPIVPTKASTKSTTKSLRRSLPWLGSDYGVVQSSANATASDSPERFSGFESKEVPTEVSSKASGARSQASAMSTSYDAKQSQGLLNTCHRVIQSNWGIQAHELLEPEYYGGQVLPERMIELLAEIASKVEVDEARRRIKEAINTRIRELARRGAGHPSQDPKMEKIDLEVVRGAVETWNMSTTNPFSLPRTNAAVEKQDEGMPPKWWDDDNTPFKSFARAYTWIQPGKGNSFAKADLAKPVDGETVAQAASNGFQLKKIDFMGWNL